VKTDIEFDNHNFDNHNNETYHFYYGNNDITLWVVGAPTEAIALEMTNAMREKIATRVAIKLLPKKQTLGKIFNYRSLAGIVFH